MAERTQVFKYLVDAAQATADAEKFNKTVEGSGTAATRGAAGVTTALTGQEKAARGAAVSGQQLQAVYQNVVRTQGANSAAAQALAAQLNNVSTAQKSVAVTTASAGAATAAAAQTTEKAGGIMGVLSGLMTTNTTQISSQGTAWQGYDAAVQSVVRSLGGIPVIWALVISIAGALIVKLFSLITAKKELAEVDNKLIETNALAAASLVLVDSAFRATAQGMAIQNAASGDMITLITNVAGKQDELGRKTANLNNAIANLQHVQEQSNITFGRSTAVQEIWKNSLEGARKQVVHFTTEYNESRKSIEDSIQGLRLLANMYGLSTDQLVAMATQLGYTDSQLSGFRQTMEFDIETLKRMNETLGGMKDRLYDVQQGALAVSLALKQIKMPKIDVEAIGGLSAAKEAFDKAAATLAQSQFIPGGRILSIEEMHRALEPATRAIIQTMKEQAAQTATTAQETLRLYNALKDNLTPAQLANVKALELQDKNLKAFTETKKKATDKVGDLTRALEKEVQMSEIVGDSYTAQEARIRLAIEQRRQTYLKEGTLTADNERRLQAIMLSQLRDLKNKEIEEFAKAAQKEREINAKALAEVIENRRLYLQNLVEMVRKTSELSIKATQDSLKSQRNDRLDQGQRQRQQDELNFLRQQQEELDKVGKLFGFVSDSTEIYKIQLEALKKFTEGDFFGGLTASIKAFGLEILRSGQLFLILGQTISGVFESAVSGQESFGKALLKGLLNAIAQIATMLGTLFLLAAAGLAFIPGLNWSAGPLIAAGIALLAFAGTLAGLASKIGGNSGAAGAAAGGGGSSAAAGGGGGNRERPPNVIPFPTSGGPQGGDNYTVIKLDRQGTKDFLDGNEVLTKDDATGVGRHSSSFYRSAIREANRRAKQRRAS